MFSHLLTGSVDIFGNINIFVPSATGPYINLVQYDTYESENYQKIIDF